MKTFLEVLLLVLMIGDDRDHDRDLVHDHVYYNLYDVDHHGYLVDNDHFYDHFDDQIADYLDNDHFDDQILDGYLADNDHFDDQIVDYLDNDRLGDQIHDGYLAGNGFLDNDHLIGDQILDDFLVDNDHFDDQIDNLDRVNHDLVLRVYLEILDVRD